MSMQQQEGTTMKRDCTITLERSLVLKPTVRIWSSTIAEGRISLLPRNLPHQVLALDRIKAE